jgi:predicted nucleic acid-binding protein
MKFPLIIYLDVCCLNRPFDDLGQGRIRIEAEAIIVILQKCQDKQLILVNSDAIEFEIARNSDLYKAEKVKSILNGANIYINSNEKIELRAEELNKLGFKLYDALHLAFAEAALANIFLTTDDRLLRKAKQYSESVKIEVNNPVVWLMTILQSEEEK